MMHAFISSFLNIMLVCHIYSSKKNPINQIYVVLFFGHINSYLQSKISKKKWLNYGKTLLVSHCKNKSTHRSDKNGKPAAQWRMPLLILRRLKLERKFELAKSSNREQWNPRGTYFCEELQVSCVVCYLIKAHSLLRQPPSRPPSD